MILECTVGRLALGLVFFFFFGCNKTPRTGTGTAHCDERVLKAELNCSNATAELPNVITVTAGCLCHGQPEVSKFVLNGMKCCNYYSSPLCL